MNHERRAGHDTRGSGRPPSIKPHPHMLLMTSWKPTPRAPAKTKEELREMLAQAVRNTQPETETKPLPKAKKVAASVAALGAQR